MTTRNLRGDLSKDEIKKTKKLKVNCMNYYTIKYYDTISDTSNSYNI
jgi:hypothetical protein